MSEKCCMEENNSRARVKICYFLLIFLSQILQNYFKVFLLALSFEIVQDICRRPVYESFVEIQSWYLIYMPPPTQRWATSKKVSSVTYANFVGLFSPEHI